MAHLLAKLCRLSSLTVLSYYQSCVLDVLRHLPRSLFSDSQMEIISWGMAVLGVDDLPSISSMENVSDDLQDDYGI